MKKVVLSCLLLILLGVPKTAHAQVAADNVTLPTSEVHEGDYFAAGDTVIVSGTVEGDAYVVGGQVMVDGKVNGDLLVAGGTVNITGEVEGDIRAAGGQITLAGVTGGNVTLMGGNLDIASNAQISGNVSAVGGNMVVNAPIPGDLKAGVGNLTLASNIEGDVDVAIGQLTLAPKAAIGGNLTYRSENLANIAPEATVSGSLTYEEHKVGEQLDSATTQVKEIGKVIRSIFFWTNLILSLVFGILLVLLFPAFSEKSLKTLTTKPGHAFLLGAGILFLTPLLLLALMITIIGIPFAFFIGFLWVMAMFLAKLIISLWVGNWGLQLLKQDQKLVVAVIVGVIISALVGLIPVIGPLYGFLAVVFGLGTLVLATRTTALAVKK